MNTPLILLPMLTLLLVPIEQASAYFCAICDGHETPLMEIMDSRKSKLSDYVGSDLGKSAPERVRKIREEPRVIDNLRFVEGEITGSRKSKLSDYVGSDLGKSAAEWARKIREEPRVIDNLGFVEGSTASGGPAGGNYCFILDGMFRNGAGDFTWPRNCAGKGDNHVPDTGSTVMHMGLALAVLAGVRHKLRL